MKHVYQTKNGKVFSSFRKAKQSIKGNVLPIRERNVDKDTVIVYFTRQENGDQPFVLKKKVN